MSHFNLWVFGDNYEGQLEPYTEEQDHRYTLVDVRDDPTKYGLPPEANLKELIKEAIKSAPVLLYSEKQYNDYLEDRDSFLFDYGYHNWNEVLVIDDDGNLKYRVPTLNNGKWDWFIQGGRWAGTLLCKPDQIPGKQAVAGGTEEKEFFQNLPKQWRKTLPAPDNNEAGYDVLRKGALDIAQMDLDSLNTPYSQTVLQTWKEAQSLPAFKTWEVLIDEHQPQTPDDRDKIRKLYNDQPAVKRFIEIGQERGLGLMFFNNIDRYVGLSEPQLMRVLKSGWVPFAFLHNGRWYERGEMGMFGMSKDGYTQEEWIDYFRDFLDKIPDDELVTVVDCHC